MNANSMLRYCRQEPNWDSHKIASTFSQVKTAMDAANEDDSESDKNI